MPFIQTLADVFWSSGIKLSHSARTLRESTEALSDDLDFLTSLLDMRLVAGEKPPFRALRDALHAHLAQQPRGLFVSQKLDEQERRHKKFGDTRFCLEPNIKEGKGGLRDIQTLLWLSEYVYGAKTPEQLAKKGVLTEAEAASLRDALRFLSHTRCCLHLAAGRATDRLSFDLQPDVAARMGYEEEEPHIRAGRFMRDYFHIANETGHLTRILCSDMESRALATGATSGTRKLALDDEIDGFPVCNNRLAAENAARFARVPSEMVRIFRVGQTSGHDIHHVALRHIRDILRQGGHSLSSNREALRIFRDILLDTRKAGQTLRRMNEAGVLTALIPEFSNVYAHMQYDMYHVFTADEHTIRAVGMMHAIENGSLCTEAPLATALFGKIHSRPALYAAIFLHDIAKGTGGSHAEKGAAIARKLCPALGLSHAETDTAAWLVEQHLLMTMTALKRNLDDPKTVADFAAAVQSPERLKLLTVLTTADIMAVGPDRWNNWKAGLLSELYEKTAALLSGTPLPEPETAVDLLRGLEKALTRKDRTAIAVVPETGQGATEVRICTPDRKGLFATLAGAMAASGASIVDARIFTLPEGLALDVFRIQTLNGKAYENAVFLKKTLRAALEGAMDLDAEIAERRKNAPARPRVLSIPARVVIDNEASIEHTLVEVTAHDRPGLLYDITATLTREGLQIHAAKVTTFGSRAMDVFYVKDAYGLKILHPEKLEAIQKALLLSLHLRPGD